VWVMFDYMRFRVIQDWFLKENVLHAAVALLDEEDAQVRLKALLLVSSMLRGCPPGLVTFCKDLHGLPKVLAMVRLPELFLGVVLISLCIAG
jgi:hypothetical protein